ncbi:MAG: Gfo/Idh/MocA family oxidoreductase [Caldilineaceae bacterium]
MTRIGVIGTGAIAQVHLDAWAQLPVELVGYYDVDQAAAERAVAKYGGQAFPTLDALLDAVDMVDICTPGTAHKGPVLAAAAAGKAIICEKPLARSLADCVEMVGACEAAGCRSIRPTWCASFPSLSGSKRRWTTALGDPGVIRTTRAGAFPGRAAVSPARTTATSHAAGVVLDVGIHDLDFQRWCCGEVTHVFTRGTTFTEDPRNDHALITLRFANGAIGHVQCAWALPSGIFRTRVELAGDEGIAEWDSLDVPSLLVQRRNDDDTGVETRGHSPWDTELQPYYAELAHFVDCFENGAPPRVTGHDGLMAVKLALAAIESMRTGAPVEIATFQEVTA